MKQSDKELTKLIAFFVLIIVVLLWIAYLIFACPNCHYPTQKGFFDHYCSHCGYCLD